MCLQRIGWANKVGLTRAGASLWLDSHGSTRSRVKSGPDSTRLTRKLKMGRLEVTRTTSILTRLTQNFRLNVKKDLQKFLKIKIKYARAAEPVKLWSLSFTWIQRFTKGEIFMILVRRRGKFFELHLKKTPSAAPDHALYYVDLASPSTCKALFLFIFALFSSCFMGKTNLEKNGFSFNL